MSQPSSPPPPASAPARRRLAIIVLTLAPFVVIGVWVAVVVITARPETDPRHTYREWDREREAVVAEVQACYQDTYRAMPPTRERAEAVNARIARLDERLVEMGETWRMIGLSPTALPPMLVTEPSTVVGGGDHVVVPGGGRPGDPGR